MLPYQPPFLFVDGLSMVSEHGVTGFYTLKEDEYFYKGHFKDHPITPGVILIEIMAQIGVVCLGIFLMKNTIAKSDDLKMALTSSQVDFYLPVYPGTKVTVVSEKQVFRFNKLKCKVKMLNDNGDIICRGIISGMIKSSDHE